MACMFVHSLGPAQLELSPLRSNHYHGQSTIDFHIVPKFNLAGNLPTAMLRAPARRSISPSPIQFRPSMGLPEQSQQSFVFEGAGHQALPWLSVPLRPLPISRSPSPNRTQTDVGQQPKFEHRMVPFAGEGSTTTKHVAPSEDSTSCGKDANQSSISCHAKSSVTFDISDTSLLLVETQNGEISTSPSSEVQASSKGRTETNDDRKQSSHLSGSPPERSKINASNGRSASPKLTRQDTSKLRHTSAKRNLSVRRNGQQPSASASPSDTATDLSQLSNPSTAHGTGSLAAQRNESVAVHKAGQWPGRPPAPLPFNGVVSQAEGVKSHSTISPKKTSQKSRNISQARTPSPQASRAVPRSRTPTTATRPRTKSRTPSPKSRNTVSSELSSAVISSASRSLETERLLLDGERAMLRKQLQEVAKQRAQLERDRAEFKQSRLTLRTPRTDYAQTGSSGKVNESDNSFVLLNVANELALEVQRSTLRAIEGSRIADMFTSDCEAQLPRDAIGRIFIDCPADVFLPLVTCLKQCRLERSLAVEKVANGQGGPVWKVPVPHFQSVQQNEALSTAMCRFGLDQFVEGGYVYGTSQGALAATVKAT